MPDAPPDLLSVFLDGRDVVCPGCGYNLRDLQCSRCPECGEELTLQVGLVEPRQTAAISGLIGLAAGLTGSVVLAATIDRFVYHASATSPLMSFEVGFMSVEG